MKSVRLGFAFVLLGFVAANTACEPSPPAAANTVNTVAPGPDADPGDGICERTVGAGDCTLQAAVEEGNTAQRAVLTVPAGTYPGLDIDVTGDISINRGEPTDAVLLGSIAISAGGDLYAEGLRAPVVDDPDEFPELSTWSVSGSLHLVRSYVFGVDPDDTSGTAMTIEPTGGVVLEQSAVLGGSVAIHNRGRLVATQSTLSSFSSARLWTEGEGQSNVTGTLISRGVNTGLLTASCAGTSPISYGYNGSQSQGGYTCGLGASSDQTFFAPVLWSNDGPSPASHPSLVDAIPLGEGGCSASALDVNGNARGVDGNGDGILGCDIGAVELQP